MTFLDLYVHSELKRLQEETPAPAAHHRRMWLLAQSRRRAALRQAVLLRCGDRLVDFGERLRAHAAALQEPALRRGW